MNYHFDDFAYTPAFNPSDFDLVSSFPQEPAKLQEQDWNDFASFCFSPRSTEAFSAPIDQLTMHSSPKSDPFEVCSLGSPLSTSSKKISKSKESKLPNMSSEDYELLFGETKPTRNKRRGWCATEDAQLLRLIDEHGKKWTEVARMMNGRTGKQVRDRYVNVLMPNIKKKNWTIAEDQLIISLYAEFGPKWTKIAEHMDGRPEVQVKNRFYTHLKKQYEAQQNCSPKTNSPLEKCLERIEELTHGCGMINQEEESCGDYMDMISFVDK